MTLRGLGAAAGVSRGTPYRHFRDKDDLLASVALRAMQRIRAAVTKGAESAGASSGPAATLEAVLVSYVEEGLRHPGQYRLIYGRELDRRRHPDLKAEGIATYAVLLKAVQDGQSAGCLSATTPTDDLAGLLWAGAHGLVDLALTAPLVDESGPGDPRRLVRILVHQLASPASTS